ncbi:MAG: S8 family serine peptidase, partial [Bacteroidia bacterium]|nr:S8 family serine peptidase [Bacteroidia bacterium]
CLLLLRLSLSTLNAQTLVNLTLSDTLGQPDPSVAWTSTRTDATGNVYLTGNNLSATQGINLLVAKYSPGGDLLWQKTYNHTGTADDYGTSIVLSAFGDVYVCGVTYSGTGKTGNYLILSYTAAAGTLNWSRTYDGPGASDDLATDLIADPTGNLYITGSSTGTATGLDYATLKYSKTGVLQWTRRYDRAGLDDVAVKIVRANNGLLTLTGGSGESTADWDYLTLQYDAAGALKKTTVTQNNSLSLTSPADLAQDAQGNTYITGTAVSNGGYTDIRTVKLDTGFQTVWIATHGTPALHDGGTALDIDPTGNVYVAGYTAQSATQSQYTVIKYTPTGTEAWAQKLPNAPGQSGIAKDLQLSPDGHLIVTGELYTGTQTEIVTLSYDAAGTTRWYKAYPHTITPGDHPLVLRVPSAGQVSVAGVTAIAGTNRYKLLTYGLWERGIDVYQDSLGKYQHVKNELVVRFSPQVLKTTFINNPDKIYGSFEEVISDNALISLLYQKLNAGSNTGAWRIFKIHPHLTTLDTIAYTTTGSPYFLPPVWADLVLKLDYSLIETIYQEKIWADSLNTISDNLLVRATVNLTGKVLGDPLWPNQRSLYTSLQFPNGNIKVDDAWLFMGDAPLGRPEVVVGVLDDGIKANHEDLGGGGSYGGISGSVVDGGYSFFTSPPTPITTPGQFAGDHGTKVAGIIAALRNNDKGIAGIAGGGVSDLPPMDGVHLMSMQIANAVGVIAFSDAASALMFSATGGPGTTPLFTIMNNSWGFSNETQGMQSLDPAGVKILQDAVRTAFKAGIIMVNARGNKDPSLTFIATDPTYPASFRDDWGISVGGANHEGDRSGLFPIHGDTYISYYAQSMDILAPSRAYAKYQGIDYDLIRSLDIFSSQNQYGYFAMTSAAAAHATGVVALIQSYCYDDLTLAPEDAEHLLEYGAVDKTGSPYAIGYDDQSGWGFLDAYASIQLLEKGVKGIYHYEVTPSPLTAQLVSNNAQITLTDEYVYPGVFTSGTTLPAGVYANVEIYKYVATVQHNLPAGTSLITIGPGASRPGYWARNSASNLWGYTAGTGAVPVEPEDQISVTATAQNGTVTGYFFRVPYQGKTYTLPKGANINPVLAYSVLVQNTGGGLANESLQEVADVQVYPNPTHNQSTLSVTLPSPMNSYYSLLDITGKELYRSAPTRWLSGTTYTDLPMAQLPPGTYLICVRTGESQSFHRIIKY